jgi:hypothetical protein
MTAPSRKEPKLLKWMLYLISGVCAVLGAVAAYGIVHVWFGYSGNKSGVFYMGGGLAGYMVSEPLWWLYRKRYPKEEETNGGNGN